MNISSPTPPYPPSRRSVVDTAVLQNSSYAYDIAYPSSSPAAPFLTNRRVFAHAGAGNPDGIKCDIAGNVYSGCGDGVHVWNAGGSLIGKMRVDGGVANLCFGRAGELFLLNEQRCWRALLGPATRGALLGI